jgi:hypothetical protein
MDVVDEIKSQYARLLEQKDWRQFKQIAEYYLRVAARLKKKDIVGSSNKLLLRNSQKRLCLGIGCELLIKAFYLKEGYCVNTFKKSFSGVQTPTYKMSGLERNNINDKNTFTLGALIESLNNIRNFKSLADIKRGFQIAMVFRNKEGHVTFPYHNFDEQNYRDIERAVICFYKEVFGESLFFYISMKPHEMYEFRISV